MCVVSGRSTVAELVTTLVSRNTGLCNLQKTSLGNRCKKDVFQLQTRFVDTLGQIDLCDEKAKARERELF